MVVVYYVLSPDPILGVGWIKAQDVKVRQFSDMMVDCTVIGACHTFS